MKLSPKGQLRPSLSGSSQAVKSAVSNLELVFFVVGVLAKRRFIAPEKIELFYSVKELDLIPALLANPTTSEDRKKIWRQCFDE